MAQLLMKSRMGRISGKRLSFVFGERFIARLRHALGWDVVARPVCEPFGDEDGCHGADGGGDDRAGQRLGRIEAALGRSVADDGDGNDRDAAVVDGQEHGHAVGGGVFDGVEGLQLGHGFEAHGRGRVVEADHVGREIHEDGTLSRVAIGDAWE